MVHLRVVAIALAVLFLPIATSTAKAQGISTAPLIAQINARGTFTYLDAIAGDNGQPVTYFYLTSSVKPATDGTVSVTVVAINDRAEAIQGQQIVGSGATYIVQCTRRLFKVSNRVFFNDKLSQFARDNDSVKAFMVFENMDGRSDYGNSNIAQRLRRTLCTALVPSTAVATAPTVDAAATTPAEKKLDALLAKPATPPRAIIETREQFFAALTSAVATRRSRERCEAQAFTGNAFVERMERWYDLSNRAAQHALQLSGRLCVMEFADAKESARIKEEVREALSRTTGSQHDREGVRRYLADALEAFEAAKAIVVQQQEAAGAREAALRMERAAKETEHVRRLRAGEIPVASISDATILRSAESAGTIILFPPVGGSDRVYAQMGVLVAAQGNVLVGSLGPRGYVVRIDAGTRFIGTREALRAGLPFGFVGRYTGTTSTEAGMIPTFAAEYVGAQ